MVTDWEMLRGTGGRQPKLTMVQAEEIRALYRTQRYTYDSLGEMFGVSESCILDLIHNRTYQRSVPNVRADEFPLVFAAPTETVDTSTHKTAAIRAIVTPRDDETWPQWRCRINDEMTDLVMREPA